MTWLTGAACLLAGGIVGFAIATAGARRLYLTAFNDTLNTLEPPLSEPDEIAARLRWVEVLRSAGL